MTGQSLYKYLPERFVDPFISEGKVLFRNLSYFRKHEHIAREDEVEGIHVDDPDDGITLTNLSTGKITKGDFRFLNSVKQDLIFIFCTSRVFRQALFEEFEANACIVIRDPITFFKRCEQAAQADGSIEEPGLIHRPVEYYKANRPARGNVKDPTMLPFFKQYRFRHQDEYRAIFAELGGFSLLERIVIRQFTFHDEIEEGTARENLLTLGNLEDIVDVRLLSLA